ncbi:MarR family winged helix-turn-helix transcriptional regulator [Shewanella sp. UCD-KL12]|uniref:MarR family winged helix-turn-helix transcriptional regulator n=1 Tax=Shewanella sp. UCD-KL12 TaxID=1917163 RepID=UPI00097042B9|nr:MarR family transcriptional regulator [Shewanella sp. UCD-KL12]
MQNETIIAIPELDSSPSFIMGLAYKQFRTIASQMLNAEFDITLEMLGALRVLTHLGEVPQQTLAETLNRERSVTKRLVDNCIKRELIIARKSDTNKKARYLVVTDKGLLVKKQASAKLQKVIDDFYSPLTSDEQKLLLSLCKKLIKEDFLLSE